MREANDFDVWGVILARSKGILDCRLVTRSRHEEPEHLDPNLLWALRYADNLPYKILISVFRFYMPGTCS